MANKLPWFRFEATAWLSDPHVRLMTSQQRGWYIDLLCWAWQEGGIDAMAMRTLCQSHADIDECDDFTRLNDDFDAILKHFTFDCGNGKVSHPKLEENRLEVSQRSEKASDSASKRWGGKRKATAKRKQCDGNANALLRASNSISSSLSISEDLKEKKDGEILRPEFDDQWQDFRRLYAETGKPLIEEDFTKAHFVWRVLDFSQRTMALANLAERKLHHDPQFIPKPERYLQGGEYARVVVARSNGNGRSLSRHDQIRKAMEEA